MCTVNTLSHNNFMPYHHGDLKRALLEAALGAIESNGVDSLSLRRISEQVGVTPNAVYRHFNSKEALLVAMSDYGFEQLATAFESTKDQDLNSIGQAYIEFGVGNPWLYRLMFSGRRISTPRHEDRSFSILQSSIRNQMGADATEEEVLQESINAWAYVHGMVMLVLDGIVQIEEVSFSF
jgi:AcrR family transcriptional regulator